MQNLGQTWIFYKLDEAHLAWTKRDQHDQNWFQPTNLLVSMALLCKEENMQPNY